MVLSGERGQHLYFTLRKELVRAYPAPLSSDAFTLFGQVDAAVHNREVKGATELLLQSVLPSLATQLLNKGTIVGHPQQLLAAVHHMGVNVRWAVCVCVCDLLRFASVACVLVRLFALCVLLVVQTPGGATSRTVRASAHCARPCTRTHRPTVADAVHGDGDAGGQDPGAGSDEGAVLTRPQGGQGFACVR